MFFDKFFNKEKPLITKPLDTKIEFITKNNDFQIVLPSQKINLKALLFLFFILLILFALAYNLQQIESIKNNIIANVIIHLPTYILPGIFVLLFIIEILFSLYGETVITCKNTWITLGYNVFGIRFFSLALFPQGNVTELVANRYTKVNASDKDLDAEITTIILWAGKTKYELGCNESMLNFSYFSLSKAEMDWLAHELSAFFGLPVFEKFWRVKTKESSLEFRRIAVTWIIPSILIISYFLIAIGSIGVAESLPDIMKALLSFNILAILLGLILIIINLAYITSLARGNYVQKDPAYLEEVFSKLVREGEGEISLVLFRRETGLSDPEATAYLAQKVEDLNAVFVKRRNNIYYYFKY